MIAPLKRAALSLSMVCLPAVALAAQLCTEDAMIVFDGSGSMSEMGFNQLDEPRIIEARRAVRRAAPNITRTRRVGLVVYGPGSDDPCRNIDLRFPPVPNAAPQIISEVDAMLPAGNTPLTEAVQLAAEVLDYRTHAGVVVLVTDGKETCGGAPCELAATLAAEAEDLTVHVIGFKVRSDHFSWESQGRGDVQYGVTVASCLADRTGGEYFTTENATELAEAMMIALGCPQLARSTGFQAIR